MKYWVRVMGDGRISGKKRLSGDAPVIDGVTQHEISEQLFVQLGPLRHGDGGGLRWSWNNGNPEEIPDNRPIVRFTCADAVDSGGFIRLDKTVGQPSSTVTVEVINAQGEVRTNVTRSESVSTGNRNVTISVVNGVGSITVPTGHPREGRIDNNERFRVLKPLVVTVSLSQELGDSEL